MPVSWTSRLSLAKLADELAGRKLEVYAAIRKWDPVVDGPGPSIEDLAEVTGRKESSICGRLADLSDLGLISRGPLKTNSTGKEAMTYLAIAWKEEPSAPVRFDRSGQGCFL